MIVDYVEDKDIALANKCINKCDDCVFALMIRNNGINKERIVARPKGADKVVRTPFSLKELDLSHYTRLDGFIADEPDIWRTEAIFAN